VKIGDLQVRTEKQRAGIAQRGGAGQLEPLIEFELFDLAIHKNTALDRQLRLRAAKSHRAMRKLASDPGRFKTQHKASGGAEIAANFNPAGSGEVLAELFGEQSDGWFGWHIRRAPDPGDAGRPALLIATLRAAVGGKSEVGMLDYWVLQPAKVPNQN
jgi:hypothetical protein